MTEALPVFIGLDLAWSSRNRTGGAVVRNGRLVAWTGALAGDDAIVAFVAQHLAADAPAVVAVDAPLCVPNQTGRRICDNRVSVEWRRYEAGAYPANRKLLAYDGSIRGERLAERFSRDFGLVQTAPIPRQGAGRYLCEVFPHPAHVALFGLERTLKYKGKRGRTPAMIRAEYARYQHLLAQLAEADPPLLGLEEITSVDVSSLRGQVLHAVEEALDAVTCAYVAYYAWWHGPAQQRIYGTVAEGHILVPWPAAMAQRWQSREGALMESADTAQPVAGRAAAPGLPPDTLNARIGVLTRREVEARMLAPLIEALGAEFGRERVIEIVRDVIVRIAQQQGAQLADERHDAGLLTFAESTKAWTQGNALELDVIEQSDDVYDFNVTRCRYAELYRALGVAELGAVFSCNRDAALIEGFNPEIEFNRTQTIMQGAPFCDFRYRRKPGAARQPIALEQDV